MAGDRDPGWTWEETEASARCWRQRQEGSETLSLPRGLRRQPSHCGSMGHSSGVSPEGIIASRERHKSSTNMVYPRQERQAAEGNRTSSRCKKHPARACWQEGVSRGLGVSLVTVESRLCPHWLLTFLVLFKLPEGTCPHPVRQIE